MAWGDAAAPPPWDRLMTRRSPRIAYWLAVLLLVTGCHGPYTQGQLDSCRGAEAAVAEFAGVVGSRTPYQGYEQVLAALPAFIDRLKSYRPGSTGADNEIQNLLGGATLLQRALIRGDPEEPYINNLLDGLRDWYEALQRRCQQIEDAVATPSGATPSPVAPLPAPP
jgi:hypothetical protein